MEAGRTEQEEQLLGVRLEILIAVGLGLAAILTALSIYLTDVHDDNALVAFNDGVRETTEATGGYVQAAQLRSADDALFTEYAQIANAAAQGDRAAAENVAYLQTAIMRDELRKQIEWWGTVGQPKLGLQTPFDDQNPFFEEPERAEAEAQTAAATENFDEAQDEQKVGDRFIIADVIVATALFMFGIAAVARVTQLKVAMTMIAYGVFLVALVVVITGL
jgi:hypothetical protein